MTISAVPPAITVMAVTSRLIDLQHSRGANIYVPDPAPNSGTYTGIALLTLNTLHELVRERGNGYVTVAELHSILKLSSPEITLEDLEFVLTFLSRDREICFSIADDDGKLIQGHVRDKTKLVDLADSRAQVRMTDNGSMLLRICENEISWLYDESDANKIITAINNGKFGDIPVICRSLSLELAKKARELTGLIEHPTREEQSELLISDGPAINENLKRTKEAIQAALTKIFEKSTIESFEMWKSQKNPDYEVGNLHAEMEVLLQSVEAVARRFVEFLDIAQQRQDVVPSQHSFLEIANSLVSRGDNETISHLETFLKFIVHPGVPAWWFDPSMLPGMIDLYDLMDVPATQSPNAFDINKMESAAITRFREFVERNREVIFSCLEEKPLPFSDFLSMSGFIIQEGESLIDFLGVYVSPEMLDDGNSKSVIIGFPERDFRAEHGELIVFSSDPVIMLAG